MSSCYVKSDYNEVYFYKADMYELEVDVIINFDDSNTSHMPILEKGGSSLKKDLLATRSGNLPCKNVLHENLRHRKDNVGYYGAMKEKISLSMKKVDEKNFKTVGFFIPDKDYNSDIIWNCCCEFLPSCKKGQPKVIHCVSNDTSGLSEKIRRKYDLNPCERPELSHNGLEEAKVTTPMVTMTSGSTDSNDNCPICLCDFTDKKDLDKCGHSFCSDCIDQSFSSGRPCCPVCQTVYGEVIGQQPPGTMSVKKDFYSLPGSIGYGMYVVSYSIPSGIQKKDHPNPGMRYHGTSRVTYLPATTEGEIVLKMLQKAFLQKLIFTVGTSRTTNMSDCVTWNDIHHKTSVDGGPFNFGYPDPDYLSRVTMELEAQGIYSKSVAHEQIKFHLRSE